MNCVECQELLNDRLDGLPVTHPMALERHLADCPSCRDLSAAAGRLEEGLRHLVLPAPPAGMTDRIVTEVLADRRRRRGLVPRRLRVAVALAASLFLVLVAGDQLLRSPTTMPVPLPEPQPEPVAVGSLRDSVA